MATSCKRPRNSLSAFEELPDELLVKIFKYLIPQNVMTVMNVMTEVCLRFQEIVKNYEYDFYSFHDFSNREVHCNDLKECIKQKVEYLSLRNSAISNDRKYNCTQCNFNTKLQQAFIRHMSKRHDIVQQLGPIQHLNQMPRSNIKYLNVAGTQPNELVIDF